MNPTSIRITTYIAFERHLGLAPWKQSYEAKLNAIAGGFTCYLGAGGWVDEAGNAMTESVMVHTIITHRDRIAKISEAARAFGRSIGQKSIYIEITPSAGAVVAC